MLAILASAAAADYPEAIEAMNRGEHKRALAELQPLADAGDPRAQSALAYMYRLGLGVPKDPQRAAHWQQRATRGLLGKAAAGQRPATPPAAPPAAPGRPAAVTGSASGLVVDTRGHVLTNHHVVAGCGKVRVRAGRTTSPASLAASDERADLALLAVTGPLGAPAAVFRPRAGAVLGESVMVAGYPLQGLLSDELHVAAGVVSGLAGPRGDPRLIQLSAPVQAGNSGGPVLDAGGRVIAVVAGVLRSQDAQRAGSAWSSDIGFAVRGELARSFLDGAGVHYRAESGAAADTATIATNARGFTVLVECLRSR